MNTPSTTLATLQPLPLTAWLNVLAATLPPAGIVLVGAGHGTGALVQWLAHTTYPSAVVEGDAAQHPHLQHLAEARAHLQVLREVVAPSPAPALFHHYSNPAENGLLALEPLQKLWPQLSHAGSAWVEDPITIDQLVATHLPQTNWLILDCNASAELLQGAAQVLPQLDVLICRQSTTVTHTLVAEGLRLISHLPGRHPSIGHSISVRDVAKEIQARQQEAAAKADALEQRDALAKAKAELQQTLEQAQQAQAELQHKLQAETQARQQEASAKADALEQRDALAQAHAALQQTLEKAQQAQAELQHKLDAEAKARQQEAAAKADALKQRDALAQAHAALQQTLAQAQQTQADLRHKLDAEAKARQQEAAAKADALKQRDELAQAQSDLQQTLAQAQQAQAELQRKLQAETQARQQEATQVQSLKSTETRLRDDLNKGLANAVKQLEAFQRIRDFLGTVDCLGDFHGWPISPDIGLFLLERMREQHYDLIIEFGSGTSTALFAQAAHVLEQQGHAPTQIVTFEHDTVYHAKTLQLLKTRGLDGRVSLVHAPLVDWREGDQAYLYYNCQATLAELAQQHANRHLRILVLVDGPPGATCPNARYPAVPLVFGALARHHIDVVLDDASRPEEKQVIELWKSFWKQRSFRCTEHHIPSEKGIYLAATLS